MAFDPKERMFELRRFYVAAEDLALYTLQERAEHEIVIVERAVAEFNSLAAYDAFHARLDLTRTVGAEEARMRQDISIAREHIAARRFPFAVTEDDQGVLILTPLPEREEQSWPLLYKDFLTQVEDAVLSGDHDFFSRVAAAMKKPMHQRDSVALTLNTAFFHLWETNSPARLPNYKEVRFEAKLRLAVGHTSQNWTEDFGRAGLKSLLLGKPGRPKDDPM